MKREGKDQIIFLIDDSFPTLPFPHKHEEENQKYVVTSYSETLKRIILLLLQNLLRSLFSHGKET